MISVSFTETLTHSIFHQEVAEISNFAETDFLTDLEQGYEIELSLVELSKLVDFVVPTDLEKFFGSCTVWLRHVQKDFRVNIIPPGGELFLMVHRGKPLSAFSMVEGDAEEMILHEQAFQKFVDNRTIKRHEFHDQGRHLDIIYLLFFLPGEEWRADVYESLKRHNGIASWTDHLERIESFVLGYPIDPRPPLSND